MAGRRPAAPKTTTPPAETAPDFEALLDEETTLPPAKTEPDVEPDIFLAPGEDLPEAEETPGQRRIRELEAQLAAQGVELEDQRIKELEDQLARKLGSDAGTEALKYAEAPTGETILLHFLEDGFTACGQVWLRGQELEFEVGGRAYNQQKDRNGNSWLDFLDDEDAQFDRYGTVMYRRGPFRGRAWGSNPEADKKVNVSADDIQFAAEETRRARRAPLID
jgi:hypothetical protein